MVKRLDSGRKNVMQMRKWRGSGSSEAGGSFTLPSTVAEAAVAIAKSWLTTPT